MSTNAEMTLLVDGKQAFPEILRCIDSARNSIEIHMFIWRADDIGLRMAEAVLRAADRGVKVTISVDRYALLLESSEECGRSFFHERPTWVEQIKISALRRAYRLPMKDLGNEKRHAELLERIMSHTNISVSRDRILADHSKYYVIDESIVFLGGINIEDKENGRDLSGRFYHDYMVKLSGDTVARAFRAKLRGGDDSGLPCRFAMNAARASGRCFEMREEYLNIIRNAERELRIVMGYFSPEKDIRDEILAAARRGVKVSVLIAESANFESNANLVSVRRLLKLADGDVRVYLSPKMVHAKAVCSEKTVSVGSCNITRRAFGQLCELNLVAENDPSGFGGSLTESFDRECAISRQARVASDVACRPFVGWLEGFMC